MKDETLFESILAGIAFLFALAAGYLVLIMIAIGVE